jgi:predicted transcriptional regulator
MHLDWRIYRTILGHLLLSILFFWYYVHNSFLRPVAEPGTEYFLALLIIVAAEVNFWVLYPAFQSNNHSFLYFVLSAVEIIILSVIEYLLTIDGSFSMIPIELTDNECFKIKKRLFTNLLFRDCGLMGSVMILAYNTDLRIRIFDRDWKLFKLKSQVLVQTVPDKKPYLLDKERICYIQQRQNYNRFFSNDGNCYERRSTLTDIQKLLGEKDFLQISKSVIVSKACLKSCNENKIVISTDENVEDYKLTIGNGYRSKVLPVVKTVLDKVQQEIPKSEISQTQSYMQELSPKALAIFQYISKSPGCKITDITENTNLPKSTVTRYLKDLQQKGLIKYEGNKRVGGYRAVNKQQDGTNAEENETA